MKRETTHRQVAAAMSDGWMAGGSFFGSIVSGMLLGYLGDRWLGTEPWLVIAGIVLGAYSGFMRMWGYARAGDDRSATRGLPPVGSAEGDAR